jgi:aspartate/methionine/tyrosine aminotransferase
VRPVERLAQNLFIAPPSLSQIGATAALACRAELDANVARYRANRDVLLASLRNAGLRSMAPADGAFYLWLDVAELGFASPELSRRWLNEIGVAVTPGIDFDPVDGDRFVRLSYSESTADVTEAARRIADWAGSR